MNSYYGLDEYPETLKAKDHDGNWGIYDEPYLQYFLQCTDARPDTGGLSGATPAEAVSWGKIDPETLPDCVVCYADSTITLPLLTAYVLDRVKPRPLKRLYAQRDSMLEAIRSQYLKHGSVDKIGHRTELDKPKKGRSGRSVTGAARKTPQKKAPPSRKGAPVPRATQKAKP
jgi:hypothetical protein